jgi:ubiquitin-conjugating enzyme E2 Q
VCHDKVNLEYEVLKPYVCNRKLCQYQFYDLSMGSALEVSERTTLHDHFTDYNQHDVVARSEVVDVLLATTYASAGEGVLDPRPIGLGLRVHIPQYGIVAQTRGMAMGPGGVEVDSPPDPPLGQDGMADFDQLSPAKVCFFIRDAYPLAHIFISAKCGSQESSRSGSQRASAPLHRVHTES